MGPTLQKIIGFPNMIKNIGLVVPMDVAIDGQGPLFAGPERVLLTHIGFAVTGAHGDGDLAILQHFPT